MSNNADQSTRLEDSSLAPPIVLTVIAIGSVVLRFVARSRTKARIGLDDLFIVLSLLSYLTIFALDCWAYLRGLSGKELIQLTYEDLRLFLLIYYLLPIFTVPAITFAKLSLLALYHRIFAVKKFRIWIYFIGITCVGWAIACFFVAVFKCYPVKVSIEPSLYVTRQDLCVDFLLFFMIIEPINCLQDLIIVLMPLNIIRNLHLPPAKRLSLIVIFALGGFVCVTSILRIVYSWAKDGASQSGIQRSSQWLSLQLAFAIVGACLPTLGPLLPERNIVPKFISDRYSSLTGRFSTRKGINLPPQTSLPDLPSDRYANYESKANPGSSNTALVAKSNVFHSTDELPANNINVKRTFHVEHV